MTQVIIRHKVKDYDAWFPVFYEHGKERRRFGCISESVRRSLADPNETIVTLQWPDVQSFEAFLHGSNLQQAMARAGVVDQPTIYVAGDVAFEQTHPTGKAATAPAAR